MNNYNSNNQYHISFWRSGFSAPERVCTTRNFVTSTISSYWNKNKCFKTMVEKHSDYGVERCIAYRMGSGSIGYMVLD